MSNEFSSPQHSKYCVHTKNVYGLLDSPKNEDAYKKMTKHLEHCSECRQELNRFKTKTQALQIYIPKVVMDRELKQSFEREVSELFKVMGLNERELLKKKVKKSVSFIDKLGAGALNHLTSKSMLKVYAVTMVLIFILKYVLHFN